MNYDYSMIEISEGGPDVAVTCRVDGCTFARLFDDGVRLDVVLAAVQEHIESDHDDLRPVTLDDIDQAHRRADAARWRARGPVVVRSAGGGGGGFAGAAGGGGSLPDSCNICGWTHLFGTRCRDRLGQEFGHQTVVVHEHIESDYDDPTPVPAGAWPTPDDLIEIETRLRALSPDTALRVAELLGLVRQY